MTPLEVIDCVIDLLQDPQRWTKGHFAANMKGDPVPTTSPDAVAYCMLGAVMHCSGQMTGSPVKDAICRALPASANGDIARYNDDRRRTHGGVMRTLWRARKLVAAEWQ